MLASFSASYSFCSFVISSMGFGMGSSTCPVMGLMLQQAGERALLRGGRREDATKASGAHTRVSPIYTPPCPSPRLRSTASPLSPLRGVLGPLGGPLHFHSQCTSTGCRLHDGIIKRIKTDDTDVAKVRKPEKPVGSPLSLQRTKRNSAAVCFTPMSTCVIRRTSLFLRVEPISGLIFTSLSGGSTWRWRQFCCRFSGFVLSFHVGEMTQNIPILQDGVNSPEL